MRFGVYLPTFAGPGRGLDEAIEIVGRSRPDIRHAGSKGERP